MATTWIKPIHVSKTTTKFSAISATIDYVENPEKTDNGRLISSYACYSQTADEEFMLSKQEYEYITGRNQGRRDVIAYHIRQSFLPGEITPEEANQIGYDLAMSFTKGNHAFVVCTHIDKAHTHNHIIFNSTSINCEKKFKNFFFSSRVVRRISDLICAENGLSIIKNPKPSRGSYADWLGDKKEPTHQDIIKSKIDEIIPSCTTFEEFIAQLKADGFEVNDKRKHISVKAPGKKKPARLNSLEGDYTESAIRARIGQARTITGGGESGTKTATMIAGKKVSLLIDIQEKIREGKGAGYEQWAKIFNLKEAAKTLVFLQENGIDSYEELVKKSSSSSGDFAALTLRIKEIEARQKEIAELQKQIATYGKTRDIFTKFKASGWDRDFYDVHAADIILHRAAKKHFNELGLKKLPTINQLKQEYATLAAERKNLYGEYHKLKNSSRKLSIARSNTEIILGITPATKNINAQRSQNNRNSHHR